MNDRLVAKIAVSAAPYWVDKPFDYLVPFEFSEAVTPGMRVVVPFSRGNRRAEGFVLKICDDKGDKKLKAIESILDNSPVVSREHIKLALWMRENFFCTVYSALRAMLPAGLWYDSDGVRRIADKTQKMIELRVPADEALILSEQKRRKSPQQAEILRVLSALGRVSIQELRHFTGAGTVSVNSLVKNGLAAISEEEVFRRPKMAEIIGAPLPQLTDAQKSVFDRLLRLAEHSEAKAALLFGVTGSGKTAVYLRLIDELRLRNKSSIMLVPEIALTPQMIAEFSSRFGEEVAVLHSSLAVGERYDEWKRIKRGDAKIVIGTRSAVFAPCKDLGLIIIDEEQEDSYRSENDPRYHARDVAKYRCARSKSLLLLGSATPSVETRYAAETGRYSFFTLPERFNQQELPTVQIVDMKREIRSGNGSILSLPLLDELKTNINNGEQSILFLNRRGANRLVTCMECGYSYRCSSCSVNLTYHSANRRLICHYCGRSRSIDQHCPECGGSFSFVGEGTQSVEEELQKNFPGIPILRMDTDSTRSAGSHELLFNRFRNQNIPIMIGTQMVTKGLNFENVTLVGVLSADQSLYAGDYRAAERTFSLITQVVGRGGRGELRGRAIIQTFTPSNQVLVQAAAQDYNSFYESEIELRKMQGSPPFFEIFALTFTGTDEQAVIRCCHEARALLKGSERLLGQVNILGPAPLIVVRVDGRYRYRVTVCCQNGKSARTVFPEILQNLSADKRFRGVYAFAELDPNN